MSHIVRLCCGVLLIGGLLLAGPLLLPPAAPPAHAQSITATPAPPTATPTPEPTLTVPQALDRIVGGEKPVETLVTLLDQRPWLFVVGIFVIVLVILGVVAVVKPWRDRFFRWIDRLSGGEQSDAENEARRDETKKQVVAERAAKKNQQQAGTARDQYLEQLEKDMLRLAKIPALGGKQRELNLEQVYVPLYVVEREQMESFARFSLGEFGGTDESQARQVAYESVQESRPVFRLLSAPDALPPPEPDSDDSFRQLTSRRRRVQRA